MSAWPMLRLGQVAEFINGDRGKNYPSEGDFADIGVPFINAGHLTNGEVDFSEMNYISESRFHLLGSGKTRQNDILYCLRGSLGKTAIVRQKGDAAIASSLVIIRPSDDCSVGYLYHFLTSPFGHAEVRKFDNGSSQPNLSANSVKNYLLPLPPLTDQRRIAEILDKAEALRAKRRAALDQLDTLAKAIFLGMQRKASHLRQIPLVEVAESTPGSFVNGPFGSNLLTSELREQGVPVIYIRDVRDGEYRRVSTSCVTEPKAHSLRVCSTVPGDVLVAKVGDPPGAAAVYPEGEPAAIVTQDVIRIRVCRTLATPEFLASYLNSPIGRWMVAGITIQATRARFSLGDFKGLEIEIPPLDVQREFSRRVAAVEKLKVAYRASLAEMDALFASLQHRAFRGEL